MKALVLNDFRDLRVEERPQPEATPGDVLVRIIATGICGSDFHGFTGENGRRVPGQIMGHETVGRVHALGEGADAGLEVGQLVTINPVIACQSCEACKHHAEQHCPNKRVMGVDPSFVSSFAEFVVVPERNVIPLAPDLRPELGALIEPLAVANHAVRRANITTDDSVLVIGGGPIGQSVILAARRLGTIAVYLSEPDERRRALCERLGATTLDPAAGPISQQLIRAHGLATVAIDAVGLSVTMNDALDATAVNGRVVLVGMGGPDLTLSAYAISTGERNIFGSFTYSADEFKEMADWVSGNPPELQWLIDRRVPLDEAQDAFSRLASGRGITGKVLVTL